MGKITFILGGARSGKSTQALLLAKKYKKVAFIATSQALDEEMAERIRLHKNSRPRHWQTFEQPKELAWELKRAGNGFDCVIIDCLTLLVSNLILAKASRESIENKINQMLCLLREAKYRSIIVSNEVGLGIVPNNKLAREFRDIAGRANQIVAKASSEVIFMVSGIPTKIREAR